MYPVPVINNKYIKYNNGLSIHDGIINNKNKPYCLDRLGSRILISHLFQTKNKYPVTYFHASNWKSVTNKILKKKIVYNKGIDNFGLFIKL